VSDVDVEQLLAGYADAVNFTLHRHLDMWGSEQSRLIESVRYSILAGGKRLRPALVYESYRACGGDPEDRLSAADLAAAAIELVHTFSLVHDDLPAMDDDDLRRGKPTNHKVFGEALAILAGDAMLTEAFALVGGYRDPSVAAGLVIELAGGTKGMIQGQALDIEAETLSLSLEQLQTVHLHKTASLIMAACRMGGICAGASDEQMSALTQYGKHLGMAFQIVDDILDVTSTPQQLGKATSKDAGSGKNTYPRLLGLEQSRAVAADHIEKAVAALDEFAASADGLRILARFITLRTH